MPKRNSKKSRARLILDDIDSLDAASNISIASDGSESQASESISVEEPAALHNLIERINAACEDVLEKRSETRLRALAIIKDAFQSHVLFQNESWNYLETFLNGLETTFKKGRSGDQTVAAECLAACAFQFDASVVSGCFSKFSSLLHPVLRDPNANCRFRGAIAMSLAVLCFQSENINLQQSVELMKTLETIFKKSCLKGDGKAPLLEPHVSSLHIMALRAWCLLFSLIPNSDAEKLGKSLLPCLISLLQAADVDMRITAGEAVALIYERLRSYIEDCYKGPYYTDLVNLLNDLAKDSCKQRSKNDRKKQRHSFREFADSVAHFESPETTINLSSEALVLSSCELHFLYDILCSVLRSGLPRHLKTNLIVRNLFGLGLPPVAVRSKLDRKLLKEQRRIEMSVAAKLRIQNLSAHRDRRSEVCEDMD